MPNGTLKARRLLQAEATEAFAMTPEQFKMLDAIAGGKAPRHAQAILKAIELKASYAYAKPKQDLGVEHSGSVSVEINIGEPK